MRIASLAMYASPPAVAAANRDLWGFLSAHLRRAGLDRVPEHLDTAIAYDAAWRHPGLLLAQTCGYPYMKHLRDTVRLVATPVYRYPGCAGPDMCSLIIGQRDNPAATLADLRGRRAAINDPGSNSGTNLLRAAVAPLAQGGRFFGSVIETGSHVASIDAVAAGLADVAAIDCVTYGHVARFAPVRLASVRVLARTPAGPGLPLITGAATTDDELTLLRQGLRAAIADPALAATRDILALADIAILGADAYQPLLDYEQAASRLGYPVIA